jgi:hypothetical protein
MLYVGGLTVESGLTFWVLDHCQGDWILWW